MTESGGIKGSQGKDLADQLINHVPLPSTSRVHQQDLVPELVHSWVKFPPANFKSALPSYGPCQICFYKSPVFGFQTIEDTSVSIQVKNGT